MGATIVKIQMKAGTEVLEGTCVDSALPLWRDKGWTLVEEKATPAKSPARSGGSRQGRRGTTGSRPKPAGATANTPPKED